MAKNAAVSTHHIKRSVGDHIFNACNITLFVLIAIIIIFPFFNIGNALLSGRIPALFAKKGSD